MTQDAKPSDFLSLLDRAPGVLLTPAQRVLAAVAFDGVDPADLEGEQRALAAQLFGEGCERVPPAARTVLALLKGARMGGSWLVAMYLLHRALTADLSRLAHGEVAFAPIVAPDLKTARQTMRHALGLARAMPSAARLIESETSDGFTLRRKGPRGDNRAVSIECLAASRGGASVRGRSMVAAAMDESSFFFDADSGVVNDSEIFRALSVRIIPGGVLCMLSTAWMRSGLLMELVNTNHGNPTTALAAIAPTLLMRPDDERVRLVVEGERRRDPQNAAREFDCVPFDGAGSAFIPADAIDAMVDRRLPTEAAL